MLPEQFDVRDEARDDDEVEVSFADRPVGDLEIARIGVAGTDVHFLCYIIYARWGECERNDGDTRRAGCRDAFCERGPCTDAGSPSRSDPRRIRFRDRADLPGEHRSEHADS